MVNEIFVGAVDLCKFCWDDTTVFFINKYYHTGQYYMKGFYNSCKSKKKHSMVLGYSCSLLIIEPP